VYPAIWRKRSNNRGGGGGGGGGSRTSSGIRTASSMMATGGARSSGRDAGVCVQRFQKGRRSRSSRVDDNDMRSRTTTTTATAAAAVSARLQRPSSVGRRAGCGLAGATAARARRHWVGRRGGRPRRRRKRGGGGGDVGRRRRRGVCRGDGTGEATDVGAGGRPQQLALTVLLGLRRSRTG